MALTPEQRAARRHCIGSSDAPAILGVDPRRSPLEVYLSKVHDLEEQEESEPMRLGNRFERAILEEAAERLGAQIQRDVTVQGPEPYLAANLDAVVIARPAGTAPFALASEALEAKFTGLGHLFGEPGTDALPEKVLVQTAFQMGCLESLELVHVPVLLARYGRPRVEVYVSPRSASLVDVVMEECSRFWRRHVEKRIPPDPTVGLGEATVEVLKRVRREPSSLAFLDPDLALAYQEAAKAAKAAEDAKARAQAALLAALGDAEGGDFGDPKKIYTYLEQKRPGLDQEALLRDHPQFAEQYRTETRFRTLRLVNR